MLKIDMRMKKLLRLLCKPFKQDGDHCSRHAGEFESAQSGQHPCCANSRKAIALCSRVIGIYVAIPTLNGLKSVLHHQCLGTRGRQFTQVELLLCPDLLGKPMTSLFLQHDAAGETRSGLQCWLQTLLIESGQVGFTSCWAINGSAVGEGVLVMKHLVPHVAH